jgi:hypothetical protein
VFLELKFNQQLLALVAVVAALIAVSTIVPA